MIGPVFNHGTYAISGASSPFWRPQTLQARQAADQDLRAVQRNVVGLRQALEGLVESLGSRSSTPQGAPSARSRLLGLQEQRLTFLESSEEINAHSTSYGPRSPRFQGRSSSHVSVRGHYDGSQGDSRLTVEVLLGGRVGGRRDPVLRVRDGEAIVTDGPFAETKEHLGGFYLLECDSLDEALQYAAKIPTATHGSVEVRPLMDLSQMPG